MHPTRHGIVGNHLFDPPESDGRGAWFASDLQATAIWDLTHAAGFTAGAVSWPVTAGARGLEFPETDGEVREDLFDSP